MHPFDIVREFEDRLCIYTVAPFAVAVASCTDALGICFEWAKLNGATKITLPKRTYIGVPMQAKRAGLDIEFIDYYWDGQYKIDPLNLWDSARVFRSDMFGFHTEGPKYKCVSFHASKILGYTHGGAILHNNEQFDKWARQARFDGRAGIDSPWLTGQPIVLGRHANMTPDVAAALMYKLYHLPKNNNNLPNSDYPDLSEMDIFK